MRSLRVLVFVALSLGALAAAGCGVQDDLITGNATSGGGGGGSNGNLSLAIAGGSGQTGTVGNFVGDSLAVKVTTNGAAAEGVTVNWTVILGDGSLSASNSTTNSLGLAKVRYALGAFPGRNTVRASVTGAGSVDFTETAQ